MDVLFAAHSGLRYLVLLAAAAVVLHAGAQLLRRGRYGRSARVLLRIYVGALDLQVVLGIALLFLREFYGALVGHLVLMLLAAVVAHATSVLIRRRAAEATERGAYGRQLAGAALSLSLVIAGILAIGRGIFASTV